MWTLKHNAKKNKAGPRWNTKPTKTIAQIYNSSAMDITSINFMFSFSFFQLILRNWGFSSSSSPCVWPVNCVFENFPLNFTRQSVISSLVSRWALTTSQKSRRNTKLQESSPRTLLCCSINSALSLIPPEDETSRLLIRRSIKEQNQNFISYLIIQVSMLSLLLPLATRRACLLILTTSIWIATRFRRDRRCFQSWWLLICCWWYRYRF